MIQYEEALAIVESRALPLRMETVALSAAVGRVLAQDVVSDHDMPPFDKSAMDGFACRRADLACVLRVVETIPAGGVPQHEIGEGECARIMTGAMIPKGADCVFMIEQSEALPENVVRFTGSKTADNIAYQGEDIRCGQVVLNAGLRIEPRHIAVLAGAGCVEPRVARRLTVGVLATGSELVAPHEAVSGPQIRETNGAQLMAQLEQAGAVP
ncbi:MAG: molybdopterin molybdotransferase MoeA, partial [Kiritimatiellaceae bacterium]|nr:molybdopterin molybdotransferase MoeA [Kiritimatiellaceae bacterium]